MNYSQILGYVHGYLDSLLQNDKVSKESVEELVGQINLKIRDFENQKKKNNDHNEVF